MDVWLDGSRCCLLSALMGPESCCCSSGVYSSPHVCRNSPFPLTQEQGRTVRTVQDPGGGTTTRQCSSNTFPLLVSRLIFLLLHFFVVWFHLLLYFFCFCSRWTSLLCFLCYFSLLLCLFFPLRGHSQWLLHLYLKKCWDIKNKGFFFYLLK